MKEPIVALVKCEDYSKVDTAVRRAVGLLGVMSQIVKKGSRVMLKPNICEPLPPERAATTHPSVVKAVAELILETTSNVSIGEQTASNERGITLKAFEVSGIGRVALETGAKVRDLQTEPFVAKDIPGYKVLDKTDFCKAVFEQDVVVNLPKFKTHGLTYVTGAVKNCFGLVHPDERNYLHKEFPGRENFCQGIVDVFSSVRPKLTIMDMVVCMEGNEGPSYGAPRKVGYIIASEDGVAADAVASYITGHNPMAVLTTRFAHERGLGVGDIDRINILGDKPEVMKDFKQHSSYLNRMKDNKGAQPVITDKCVRCGACYKKCPVGAIEDIDGKYMINKAKCIRCYCCVEVCVHGAVGLKKEHGSKVANLRLGLECDHACLFCTISEDREETLTTEEAKKKIEGLAADGVATLTFTGGEPTLREDLLELIEFARARGISNVDLQTNGAKLADKNYVKELKKAGLGSVLVALHSHKKEVSDWLTCSEDFGLAVEGIRNAVGEALNVSVSHVINSENYMSLRDFAAFIEGISPRINLYFGFVRPNGRTRLHKEVVPRLWQVERHLHDVMAYCSEMGLAFSVEGVPLCYMGGFEKYSAETQRMAKEPQIYAAKGESRHDDLHEFIHANLKGKGDACRVCLASKICAGVWKEYEEMYGTKELYPIFEKVKL